MQRRLLAEADLSLKKAFELIQGMEAAAKNAEEMQQDSSTDGTLQASANVVTDTKARRLPCSRCLGTGHGPTTCKFRTAKYNKCHKLSHLATACHSSQLSRQDQGT